MKAFALIPLAPLVLAACTPVGDDRISTGGAALSPDYQTFASTEPSTSELAGVALQQRENPNATALRDVSGTLNHASGATTINDGTYELTDPDGFAPNGILTDGISALVVTPVQGFSTNYSYMRAYRQGYITGGVPYATEGVIGVVTRTADMPSAGSAVFAGEAEGTFENSAGIVDLDNGEATVTANFAGGTVSVRMDGFDTSTRDTGQTAAVGFDAVEINGMRIAGNGFSGGTMVTLSGSTSTSTVGARAEQSTGGRFYGLTTAGRPDEVGGIGYLRGADGSVSTIFMAD